MGRITVLEINVFMKNGDEETQSQTFEKQMTPEEVRELENQIIVLFRDANAVILKQSEGHKIVIPMQSITHYEIRIFEEDEVQL